MPDWFQSRPERGGVGSPFPAPALVQRLERPVAEFPWRGQGRSLHRIPMACYEPPDAGSRHRRGWLAEEPVWQRRLRSCRRRSRGRCGHGRLMGIRLPQQSTSDAQRALRLFHVNRFRQNKICADAKGLGNSRLPLDHGHSKGTLIGSGIARALEQQSRVLLVLAVDHNRIKMLRH